LNPRELSENVNSDTHNKNKIYGALQVPPYKSPSLIPKVTIDLMNIGFLSVCEVESVVRLNTFHTQAGVQEKADVHQVYDHFGDERWGFVRWHLQSNIKIEPKTDHFETPKSR